MDNKISVTGSDQFHFHTREEYHDNAFCRNIGLLAHFEQEQLKNVRIAIPGMGGVGGLHLMTMVRAGVGKFNIADFDRFEPANINRQFGANSHSFGKPKVEVMKEQALAVNPYLQINVFDKGLTSKNIDQFLQNVDLVIDGLDFFCFDVRRELFVRAREKGIHVITAGPMGYSCAMLIFSPKGMGYDEYFNINDKMNHADKALAFAMGLSPRYLHYNYIDLSQVDLEHSSGPSLSVACQLCAGMAGTEALRILLKKKGLRAAPCYTQFDPFLMKLKKGRLVWGNKNPVQRIKLLIAKKITQDRKKIQKQKAPEFIFEAKEKILPDDLKAHLINAGIQAPSGDNAQPWKFKTGDNTISVRVDTEADKSFFNINQIASIISCGAVIENIKIAASNAGLKTIIKQENIDSDIGATLVFEKEKVNKDNLYDYIWERHTNRSMYKKCETPESIINTCKDVLSSFPGSNLYCIKQRKDIKKIARIVYKVDRIRTEHRFLHEHLNNMIRFDSQQEKITLDGLPLKNLQAGIAGEIFLRLTKSWPVMNVLNKIGVGRMVALHSYQSMINSSSIMLLCMKNSGFKDFLKGGQALQRVWLELTRLGYHVQPMTAVTLFYMRNLLGKGGEFSVRHSEWLNSLKEQYYNLFPGLEENNGQVMLFRIGHGKRIKHFTKRKYIDYFLRNQ